LACTLRGGEWLLTILYHYAVREAGTQQFRCQVRMLKAYGAPDDADHVSAERALRGDHFDVLHCDLVRAAHPREGKLCL